MKGGKQPLGYTIVEVMIVLAVSGVMFIIAANFVSGKQANTAFHQGVNTLTANIQTGIEDVVAGHYSDVPINCSVQPSTPHYLKFTSSGLGQGTNQNCVFLGKLFHFSVAGVANNYEVFALAGSKVDDISGGPLTSLNQSALTTITDPGGTGIDFTHKSLVPEGLDVDGMKIDGAATNVFDFGFVQGFGLTPGTKFANSYTSGAQTVSMITNPNVGSTAATSDVATAADGNGTPSQINETVTRVVPAKTVLICITDGIRRANIRIGDNGNQLKAVADFSSGVTTC